MVERESGILRAGVASAGHAASHRLRGTASLLLLGLLVPGCGGTDLPGGRSSDRDAGEGTLPPSERRVFALEQVSSRILTNPNPFSNATAVSSLTAWLRVEWQRVGTEVSWEETLCTMESNEVFGTVTRYPAAFLEMVPVRTRHGLLSAAELGATFEAGPLVDVYGAALVDPAIDPLPTSPDDPTVEDTDRDGEPGVTVEIDQSLLGEGQIFVSQRTTTRLEGTVLSPDRIEGVVRAQTEQSVLGATAGWLEGGTESVVDPDPAHNTFVFQAIPDSVTCLQIVLDREAIFGGG